MDLQLKWQQVLDQVSFVLFLFVVVPESFLDRQFCGQSSGFEVPNCVSLRRYGYNCDSF